LVDAVDRLMTIGDTSAALHAARSEIDAVLWSRDVRAAAGEYTTASRSWGARDSAAIDGADVATAEDSPMGRVLGSAQAVTAEVPAQVDTWARAPLQVFARLQTVVAHGHVPEDQLGRPRRAGEDPDDPLRLPIELPTAESAAVRLTLLSELATESTDAPALAIAGIVHAELLTARPFTWGSGLLGRAAVRLVLAARGVDPSLFSIPEAGILQRGRPAYVNALRQYASGDPEQVADYFSWFADVVSRGARAATPTSG
jgi:hypothetical protein